MTELTLKLTVMANGGPAMGRDPGGRPVFVPYTIPGETVRARLTDEHSRYARAELIEVLDQAPERIEPRCDHFGVCGGCHFQHMNYEVQLKTKRDVAIDQLQRIGGLKEVNVQPVLPNPTPWVYRMDAELSPTPEGDLGYWAPTKQEVVPIDTCHIIHPLLMALWRDIDLDLAGLRKLTLRVGDDDALLAAFEVEDVEPPALEADFPVSVAIILPDDTAASLVGDNYIIQAVKGRDFRVSPGCFFQPSPAAAALLIDAVLDYAALSGSETVVEGYSGVGMLTAFLAERATQVLAVEQNPDAVADTAVNLDDRDNVSVYQGMWEEVGPFVAKTADLVVVDPPSGLSNAAIAAIGELASPRLVYISDDIASLARDSRPLARAGYRLAEVQPVDIRPQTYHIDSVSLWLRDGA